MELYTYWRIFARRWWLALLPALIVVAYTARNWNQPSTVYQAYMNFSAGLPPEDKTETYTYDGYYAWLTSEYVANGLADVARRGQFAQAVSARLAQEGLNIPPGAVQGAIASDNAQSLLVIYVTWGDPDTILHIADAITRELAENAGAYFPQLDGLDAPPVRRMDAPAPVALPPSLRSQITGPAMRVAMALAAGLALVFLLHYLDPTIREREELRDLGIEVQGEIPRRALWRRNRDSL